MICTTIDDLMKLPGSALLAIDKVLDRTKTGVRMHGTPQETVSPLALIITRYGEGVVKGLWIGVIPFRMTTYPMNVPLSFFDPKTWGQDGIEAFIESMMAPKADRNSLLRPAVPFILEAETTSEIEAILLCKKVAL